MIVIKTWTVKTTRHRRHNGNWTRSRPIWNHWDPSPVIVENATVRFYSCIISVGFISIYLCHHDLSSNEECDLYCWCWCRMLFSIFYLSAWPESLTRAFGTTARQLWVEGGCFSERLWINPLVNFIWILDTLWPPLRLSFQLMDIHLYSRNRSDHFYFFYFLHWVSLS